jgi:3-oxoacyl-[acyl-carrier-protein] synthase-3
MLRSVVLGCGSYLPRRVLPNSELSRMVDTSD